MYDDILVPTDGSSDARNGAEHAIELAAALGSTIHVLYVIEEGTNPWNAESLDDQLDRAREYGNELTGEVADLAAEAGVDSVTETTVDPNVSRAINEYAQEEGMDAIVMGSGFRGTMGDLLGSTADKVLRMSTIPVTIIKRGETE